MSVITVVALVFTELVFYQRGSNIVFIMATINAVLMLLLWTAFATTIQSRPARWLHPFSATEEAMAQFSGRAEASPSYYDLQMQQAA